jgi:hypothetical protein
VKEEIRIGGKPDPDGLGVAEFERAPPTASHTVRGSQFLLFCSRVNAAAMFLK